MKKFWKSLMFAAIGVFALSSCEDVPAPYPNPGTIGGTTGEEQPAVEPAGQGTLEDPWNVAAANQACASLQQSNSSATYLTDEIYVKGIISAITEIDNGSYGNATYYISDDGTTANHLEVYRGYYLNGNKFTAADQIKVGDEVVVAGKLQNWLGTYEFTQGSKLVSINGNSEPGTPDIPAGEPKGDGTEANPFNPAGVNAFIKAGDFEGKEVYITGIICDNPNINTEYGNATFHISEDGTSGSEQFYVFRTMGFNGEKIPATTSLRKGNTVVIRSTVVVYNGTVYETEAGKGVLISVNGEEAYDETEVPGDEEGVIKASDLGLANAADWTNVTVNGVTFTPDGGGNSNTPKYYNTGSALRMYPKNSLTISAEKTISKITLVCNDGSVAHGNVGAEPGNVNVADPVVTISDINAKTVKITNNDTATGTASQLRIVSFAIVYAE